MDENEAKLSSHSIPVTIFPTAGFHNATEGVEVEGGKTTTQTFKNIPHKINVKTTDLVNLDSS